MSDYRTMRMFATGAMKFPTCIQECRVKGAAWFGRFSLVGSVPADLVKVSWGTLEEARAAVEAAGVERYQLPDCSWNKPE